MGEDEKLKKLRERIENLRDRLSELKTENDHLEKNFESAFNLLDDAIFQVNNDFKIEKINYAGLKLLDKNAEDVIGRNCYEVIHNTDEPVENCPHVCSQKSGKTETLTTFSEPLGKWLDVKDSPVFWEADNVAFHLHLIRDITAQKEAEKKLRDSEEKFKVLSENVSDGVILVENGTITYVSSGYQKLIGLSDVELRNIDRKKLLNRIHPDDRFIIETIIKDSQKALFSEYKYKYRIQHGNGNYIWVEDKINSNYNDEGNCILSIIHSRDIHDSMEYELRLISEKKELEKLNIAKNKLLSIIAHDLRNPFSAILGASDILLHNIKEGNLSELEFLAETINNSAENAYFLLENLLAWSRSQRGLINLEPKLIKLKDLIGGVISNTSKLAENKKIAVESYVPKSINCYSDPAMTEFIIRNLIINAIKFTPRGGKIKLSAEYEGKYTLLKISDNGIGMNEDKLSELFQISSTPETLGTNNEKGSDLGLILCKDFIESNSGEIWAESTEGEGSTFFCRFLKESDSS